MMVDTKQRWAFITCPKTGTETMYSVLPRFGGVRYGRFHEHTPPPWVRRAHCFGLVRNPYARAISAWLSNMHRAPEEPPKPWKLKLCRDSLELVPYLRYFLCTRNRGPRPLPYNSQSRWYAGLPVGRFLHTETLEADFNALPFVTEPVEMPHENATEHGPWQESMTPEVVRLVNEWAGADFETFGYERLEPCDF